MKMSWGNKVLIIINVFKRNLNFFKGCQNIFPRISSPASSSWPKILKINKRSQQKRSIRSHFFILKHLHHFYWLCQTFWIYLSVLWLNRKRNLSSVKWKKILIELNFEALDNNNSFWRNILKKHFQQ